MKLAKKLLALPVHAIRTLRYGSSRRISDLATFVRNGGEVAYIDDERVAPRASPEASGALPVRFSSLNTDMPNPALLTFPDGKATGYGGFCYNSENTVIRETTWFNDNLVPSNLPATFRKPTYVEGTCLALVSEFAAFNFGHMLLDALSRAQIPHECGVGMDQIDHFYLYRPTSDTGWQMLDSLGISREKCIWAEDVEMVVADKLLVTTFPGTRRNYHPIVTRALKRPLQKCPSASPKRRFYVPRTGARSVENEDELISIVRRYGFEVYDYRHEPDEFAAFADAKIVVGAHGSDIALIGAAGSGSTLLELVPSDHMHPYFYSLALGAGVEYHCIVGLSEEHRESMEGGASRVSFKICPSSEHLAQLAA